MLGVFHMCAIGRGGRECSGGCSIKTMTKETKLPHAQHGQGLLKEQLCSVAMPSLFKMLSKDNFPVATCYSDSVRAGFSGLSMLYVE